MLVDNDPLPVIAADLPRHRRGPLLLLARFHDVDLAGAAEEKWLRWLDPAPAPD
ncbi:hypothetical protein [Pseudonocardia nigra]|uniref:hypothetical protein n=1 Tax=Pseudonocardia nigra TaxID=1921578 RepID=UPI001C5D6A5A|nr:hypothetical protein [Pseudonocardia nigra]